MNPPQHSPLTLAMSGVMIRCTGEKNGERCHRRLRLVVPKGAKAPDLTYTCDGCKSGRDPYVPKDSERKGQQKQAKKKK